VPSDREQIDWARSPDVLLEVGERAEDLVTVWLMYDDGPTLGARFSAAGRWKLERHGVAALPLGNGLHALRGVPPAMGNWGDVVRCTAGRKGRLVADGVVRVSGHRTYRVLASDRTSPLLQDVARQVERLGVRIINAAGRLWLLDVPPSVDVPQLEQVLASAQTSGLIRYEDAADGSRLLHAVWEEPSKDWNVWRRIWHYRVRPYFPARPW
jgi:hypothetical protein